MIGAERYGALQAENEWLRERVAQLEAALGVGVEFPPELRLTPNEARVLGVLWKRKVGTRDALMAALYRDRGRDEADPRIVDVYMSRLRRKLGPPGISIETRKGYGSSLTVAGRARLAELLGEEVRSAA